MASAQRTIRVVAAIIERNGRYLITQRRPAAVLPLLWEFPGGRVEDAESDRDALRRSLGRMRRAHAGIRKMASRPAR